MRCAPWFLAFMLLSAVHASAQVAATPQDEAYCEKYYRLGAAAHSNCVLNSRIGPTGPYDDFGPGVPHRRYYW